MEHVLRAADVVASVRKMLAGRMTKAQLAHGHFAPCSLPTPKLPPYDPSHERKIHMALYQLMFMEEGPEYELDDAELHAMVKALEED